MHAIESIVSRLSIGEAQVAESLSVFPLFHADEAPMDYLLLDEALESELAHVTEVSQAGSVPELAFENASDKRVLLVDGDELVGARQNRIVNISILVGAGRKLVIPVSCVEQGRWAYRSARFAAARRSLFASAKARKMAAVSRSMREDGARRSNQGEVWGDIGEQFARRSVSSATPGAMRAEVSRFLEAMVKAAAEQYAALGDGADVRIEGDGIAGGALVDGERVVHLAAYSV